MLCKQDESVVRPNTRKVILTSSTLYNVWSYQDLKMPIHVDIESIVGGRFRDLTRALIMLYLKFPERLEILVVAGLNNIGENQAVPDILDEIVELKQVVETHSTFHGHKEPSLVSFSTVMYAPKFCSLEVPPSKVEWIPPRGFNNRRHDVECLNAAIAAINKTSKVNYLNLHYEGVRMDKVSGKKFHRFNQQIWREVDVRKKLHLNPQHKIKLMEKVSKLFMGGLNKLGDWDSSTKSQ